MNAIETVNEFNTNLSRRQVEALAWQVKRLLGEEAHQALVDADFAPEAWEALGRSLAEEA